MTEYSIVHTCRRYIRRVRSNIAMVAWICSDETVRHQRGASCGCCSQYAEILAAASSRPDENCMDSSINAFDLVRESARIIVGMEGTTNSIRQYQYF
jgi:hypothetical protein